MEKMSMLKVLLVTIPQNLLCIYLAFLITGNHLKLPFRDNQNVRIVNIMKLVAAVALMSTTQYIARASLDMVTYFLFNCLSTVVILKLIYFTYSNNFFSAIWDGWKTATLQVLIMNTVLITIECIFIPIVLNVYQVSMQNVLDIESINIVASQIDNFLELVLIALFWNFHRTKQNIALYQCKNGLFLFVLSFIIVLEFGFVYLYIHAFNSLSISMKVLGFCLCVSLSVFNCLCFKSLTVLIDKIVSKHRLEGG